MFDGLVSAAGQLTATTSTNSVPDPLMVLGGVVGERQPPVLIVTITPNGTTPYTLSVYPVPNISNPTPEQANWVDITLAPDSTTVIASQSLLDLIARTTAAAVRAEGIYNAVSGFTDTTSKRKAYNTSLLPQTTRWRESDGQKRTSWFSPGDTKVVAGATVGIWRDSAGNDIDYVPPYVPPDTGAY